MPLTLCPRASLLGGLLKHYGHKGPVRSRPSGRVPLGLIFVCHRAEIFPSASITLSHRVDMIDAIFRALWGYGHDPNDPVVWDDLCAAAADAKQRIEDTTINAELRQNTDEAVTNGVFGVPTLAINGQLFWGYDSTDFACAYINDPTLFDSAEMQRMGHLPSVIQRGIS